MAVIDEGKEDASGDLLPPSLRVVPNIPLHEQTLDELRLERAHWQRKVDGYTGWGAGYSFAWTMLEACDTWIARHLEKDKG